MIFFDCSLWPLASKVSSVLNDNDWNTISTVSNAGDGANYWSIGDKKNVHVSGVVGSLDIDNTFQVFIIGFDHNKDLEGSGITFQGFKNYREVNDDQTDDVCICDEYYNKTSGSSIAENVFSINHGVKSRIGGWKKCDLRFDILGSTDVYGEDATELATESPNPGTLMAALPLDLRKAMRPMTIYTDNSDIGSRDDPSLVSATVDFLPILSTYEVFGDINSDYANKGEFGFQQQYEYYKNGGSKVRNDYSYSYYIGNYGSRWSLRSPLAGQNGFFALVTESGEQNAWYSDMSFGLSVVFRV